MNFTEILTEIYNITSRPDLVDLTKTAVKAATLKAHQTDFYSKDIYELSLQFTEKKFIHSLDYISKIPNYRALKYMRNYDTVSSEPGKFFTVITPEEVLDKYNRELLDICYVAGRVIEIRSSIEFDTILVGCYVLPNVVEAEYSSWIAELYPYVIVHEAARFVFGSIALQAESKFQAQLVSEQYAELKINALTDVGS